MPETTNLPGIGAVPKKYVVFGGIGVVILGALYYRHKQQQAATASAGANTGIDPATGYAYGSAEDAAALAAQQGYVNPGTGAGSIGGTTGYVPPGQTGVPGAFKTNADWDQYAVSTLENQGGVSDSTKLVEALGYYITGQTPPPDEITLINQAVAVAGYPPIAGSDGYPPHIRTDNIGASTPAIPGNTHVINVTPTRAEVVWEPVTGATGYRVREPGGYDVFTADTFEVVDNLDPGHAYTLTVRAVNGDIQGADATVSFSTPANMSGWIPSPGSPIGGSSAVNSGGTNAPGMPTGLRIASSEPNKVMLMWDAVNGATGYRIRHTGGYDAYTGDLYEFVGNLDPGKSYTMTVQAVNATGQGQPASITFTTPQH